MSKKVILSDNALQVAKSRYFHNGENWEDCVRRVAKAISEVEGEKKKEYEEKFFEMLYNMDFIPGGRILRNAGRTKGSMLNCHHLPCGDSIEEIGEFLKDALILWASGSGVGVNFSNLRCEGDPILGKGGESSGAVTFLEAADAIAKTIQSGGCFAEGTLISTDMGLLDIKDIVTNMIPCEIITHKGLKPISTYFDNGERDVYCVTTENGYEVETTMTHQYKVLNEKGEFCTKLLSELSIGDRILVLVNQNIKNDNNHVKMKTNVDYIKRAGCTTLNVNVSLPEELDENLAYVLGHMFANGSIIADKKISVAFNSKNLEYIDKYYKLILNLFGVDPIIKKKNNENCITINLYSRIIIEYLKLNNCLKQKCGELHLPNQLFKSPSTVKAAFIAGMFDGDGYCAKKVGYTISSICKNFLLDIQLLLSGLGIASKVKCVREQRGKWKPLYHLSVTSPRFMKLFHSIIGKESLKSIEIDTIIDKTYKYEAFNPKTLGIKEKIYERFWPSNGNGVSYNTFYRMLENSPVEFEKYNGLLNVIENKIVSIEHRGTKHIYDLEVKDVHMLSGNGIYTSNSRRAAGLCSLDISHPEIEKFIDAKLKDGKISTFNISVNITNDFIDAVEKDLDWDLKFNHKVYKTVKARYLWNKIINNMVEKAEPGILNMSNLTKNNSYYFDPITGVNPCGEATLSPHGVCVLGSLVLPNYITGTTNTNWQKLEKSIKIAVRFLDNVLDCNNYELRPTAEKSFNSRRIGLGVMGLADYLFAKELRYGSEESLIEIEKLLKFIRDKSYEASVEIAKEKGAFPKFDPVEYCKASFVRKLPAKIRSDIKRYGIRNVTSLAIAPTGTISLLSEVTSGIEPLIFKSYKRNDRVGERIYIHPKYKQLLLTGNPIPKWFVDMHDLKPEDHLEIHALATKYIDGAVSKTCNMPAETTPDKLTSLLLEYIRELKGVTVYVDGSREGQIYNSLTEEEALEFIMSEMVSNNLSIEDVECNCQKAKDENGEEIEMCEIPHKES